MRNRKHKGGGNRKGGVLECSLPAARYLPVCVTIRVSIENMEGVPCSVCLYMQNKQLRQVKFPEHGRQNAFDTGDNRP